MSQSESRIPLSPLATGVLIFVVAFAARAAWVATLKNDLYWSDEHAFTEIARHLAHGEGYISESYRANPMLPVYLSVVFRFFGENLLVARLGQCLAGALTCVLIYGIGACFFNELVGAIAGLILAVYPPHIYLSGVFYAECMLIFWGAMAVYLAVRGMQAGAGVRWGVAAGVALGLAVLTRSTLLVWIPCICFAWLWQGRAAWRTRLPLCAAFFLGSAVTILPWTIRNYFTFRAVVPVSSGLGTVLWIANNPFSTGVDHTDWDLYPDSQLWNERLARLPAEQRTALETQYKQVEARMKELDEQYHDSYLVSDRVLAPLAVRYILSHPLQTSVRSCRRLQMLFSAFSQTVSSNEHTRGLYKTVAAISFYPVLALAVCGMGLGLSRFRDVALLYLLILSVIGFTSLLTGTQTRYRLPIDPYLIVFASVALARLWPWKQATKTCPAV